MIDPSLLKLTRLRWRAALRRIVRGSRRPGGAFFFILGVIFFVLWLAPAVIVAVRPAADQADASEYVRAAAPLVILGMCLLSLVSTSTERAIYFSPAEVSFLFAGPYGRRELIAYKLIERALMSVLSALFFSVILLRWAGSWPGSYLGCLLSVVFIQYFTVTVTLIGQTMAERAYTRLRRILLGTIAVLLALGLGQLLALRRTTQLNELARLAGEVPWLHYALLPLEPFGRIVAATSAPGLLTWSAAALAINLALGAFIIWLDAEYREASVNVSQRVYERVQRAQRTGMAPVSASAARRRLPQLPWLGGAGPIAWRQLMNAVRNTRALLSLVVFVGAYLALLRFSHGRDAGGANVFATFGVWMAVFLVMFIRFDFRSDIEHMDWFKMLPLRSVAIVVGQLTTPVFICSLMELIVAAFYSAQIGRYNVLVLVAAFAPPVNFLLFGAANALFLLSPSRSAAAAPGDFQFFGRQILFLFAQTTVAGVGCAIAIVFGALVYAFTDGSVLAGAGTTWLVLAAEVTALIALVAWVYRRFDVSVDTPA